MVSLRLDMQMVQVHSLNDLVGEKSLNKLKRGVDYIINLIYNSHLMEKISNKEVKLSREQYLKLGSDYNILTDMYEMKLGHELRSSGSDFILKFIDEHNLDMFIGYIYNQYLREI